jgi:hypothetical protein
LQSTSGGSPTSGGITIDGADATEITEMNWSTTDADGTNVVGMTNSMQFNSWIRLFVSDQPDVFIIGRISGIGNSGTHYNVLFGSIAGAGGFFANGDSIVVTYSEVGPAGETGATGPEGPSGLTLPGSTTDSTLTRWVGTGGDEIEGSTAVLTDAGQLTVNNLKTAASAQSTNDVHIQSERPNLLFDAIELVGGIAFHIMQCQFTNTDDAGPIQTGVVGVYGAANQGVGDPSGRYMYFDARSDGTWNKAMLKLDSNGKVGIGIASSTRPTDDFQVDVSSTFNDTIDFNGGASIDSSGDLVVQTYSDGTRPSAGTAGRIIFNSDDGNLNIDNGSGWILPDGTTT